MNVEEARQKQEVLEAEIKSAICRFEESSGCEVYDVVLHRAQITEMGERSKSILEAVDSLVLLKNVDQFRNAPANVDKEE